MTQPHAPGASVGNRASALAYAANGAASRAMHSASVRRSSSDGWTMLIVAGMGVEPETTSSVRRTRSPRQ